MDLKCPSSGESQRNDWTNIAKLTSADEVKFVVGDRQDFDWALHVIERHDLARRCAILMSAVFGQIEPRQLAEWILQSGCDVRFQLQLHKLVWDPSTIGV